MIRDLTLPEKLKKLRLAHGYSQDYVASKLNISRQGYQHYESGRRTPSNDYLLMIAQLYNLQLYDLLLSDITLDFSNCLGEELVYPQSVAEMEQRLLKAFRKLKDKEKLKLVKHAETMVWKNK